MTIDLKVRAGRCRWCGCTDLEGCAQGCSWADRARTLCSLCVVLEDRARTIGGRRLLALEWRAGIDVIDPVALAHFNTGPKRRRGLAK